MNSQPDRRGRHVVLAVAAALFLLAWVPSLVGPYGYFIDEFYYLACAARPAWGYVDHPPLSILVLRGARAVLGDSLPALRLIPALAGAVTVLLTGVLARRFGASAFGQGLAALAIALAPIPLIFFGLYSMNSIEMLVWTGSFLVLASLLEGCDPRRWWLLGVLLGLGLLNKHTTVLLGASIALGLLVVPARRQLATRWPWLAAGVASLILAPNLVWQQQHGWPSLEFYRNADLYKNVPTPPLEALLQQVLFYNPGAAPIWLAGLWFFLRSPRGRNYRAMGWACASLLLLMVFAGKSRPDRSAAMYPALFAAGAAWIESLAERRRLGWLKPAALFAVLAGGLVFLPIAAPLLPPDVTASYAAATGVVPQIERGAGKATALPQWLADRFGWGEFVADVEAAAQRLKPEEREHAVILAPSYGHAGALELLAGKPLPPVLCPHNTYHLWGQALLAQRQVEGGLAVGWGAETWGRYFEEVEQVGTHRCERCMPWRSELPIFRVWRAREPLAEVWPRFKHFE